MHVRALAMKKGRGVEPPEGLVIVPKNLAMKFDTKEGRKIIEAELNEAINKLGGKPDLVAFDPLRRMLKGDENSSEVIAEMWRVVDAIQAACNAAVWINHHIQKPPADRSGWDPTDPFVARGSGDIYGGGDAFVNVVPGPGHEDWRKLSLYFESKRAESMEPAHMQVTFKSGKVECLGRGWTHTWQEKSVRKDGSVNLVSL